MLLILGQILFVNLSYTNIKPNFNPYYLCHKFVLKSHSPIPLWLTRIIHRFIYYGNKQLQNHALTSTQSVQQIIYCELKHRQNQEHMPIFMLIVTVLRFRIKIDLKPLISQVFQLSLRRPIARIEFYFIPHHSWAMSPDKIIGQRLILWLFAPSLRRTMNNAS